MTKLLETVKEIKDFVEEKLNEEIVCATKSIEGLLIKLVYAPANKKYYVYRKGEIKDWNESNLIEAYKYFNSIKY